MIATITMSSMIEKTITASLITLLDLSSLVFSFVIHLLLFEFNVGFVRVGSCAHGSFFSRTNHNPRASHEQIPKIFQVHVVALLIRMQVLI